MEAANPLDPIRASKCFQKAFELDAREGDAARRLAEGFAEEREWDLVEVIANRTIEGEGGFEDSQEIMAGRYLPVNAWAWKASGLVHLVGYYLLSNTRAGLTPRGEPGEFTFCNSGFPGSTSC